MRITTLLIRNYKSFDDSAEPIYFYTPHSLLVGKNNAGKSNILSALDIVLGGKNPNYIKLREEDIFDIKKPVEIQVTISEITNEDKRELFEIPHLTKQQKGALSRKPIQDIDTVFDFQYHFQNVIEESVLEENIEDKSAETVDQRRQFEIKLWGFTIRRKIEDIRFDLIRLIKVPAVRDISDELSSSSWTIYGQLMKSVFEESPEYGKVVEMLKRINEQIQRIFGIQKRHLLSGARIVSYVDDINFELTKIKSRF